MPPKKKSSASKAAPPAKATGSLMKKKPKTLDQQEEDLVLTLPTEKSIPAQKIEEYNFLLYGQKGIGKTSLAAEFDRAFSLQFEPGGKSLESFQRPCPDWIHFRKYVQMLKEGGHDYNTLVIDTATLSHERCMDYVCKKQGFAHPSDAEWGKGWKFVSSEFNSQMALAMSIGMGFVATAHNVDREVSTASGRKFNKMMPNLSGQADGFFSGPIDIVGYYFIDPSGRWLQIQPSDYIEAKCRPKKNFITPEGIPIFKIPMGSSPEEAYQNLVNAFENRQTESYWPEGQEPKPVGAKPEQEVSQKKLNRRARKASTN